jgi:hydrophobe/amphiphile efflux-1 (HAE1) family protein
MKLSDICIKRPVFATVLSLIIVLIGLSGYHYLNTRYFPLFTAKHITVTSSFPSASAKLVETEVTDPLESALSTVPGIERMTSKSVRGSSTINLKVKAGEDIDEIINDVRNQVSSTQSLLPTEVKAPTVRLASDNNQFMILTLTDPRKSPQALRDYARRYLINQIMEVPGMATVSINGASPYAMRIEVDPIAMASRNLSITKLAWAISNNNQEDPDGVINTPEMDFPVTTDTLLKSAKQFSNIVISDHDGQIIRIGDVAKVKFGPSSNSQSQMLINGKPGIMLALSSQADASPISVSNKLHPVIARIKHELPAQMKLSVFYDQAVSLKQAVHEVYATIGLSILCVTIAIFIFLGTFRAVFIPIITVPVCLIGAFALMYFLGFTLNVITLLALVLSIGLVVDDAIIMLENIHRHMEKGLSSLEAAFKGSRQIAFAVIGMTICLVAVYAPVSLLHGRIATIFKSFAFTLAGAVLISGFVALTLSPMLCSKLLTRKNTDIGYSHRLNRSFAWLASHYQKLLQFALRKRLWVVGITIALAIGGGFIFSSLHEQFMPAEDIGFVVNSINPTTGASFSALKKQADTINKFVEQQPGVANSISIIDTATDGMNAVILALKPYSQRKNSAKEIAEQLSKDFKQVPGLNAFSFAPSPFSGNSHQDLTFTLMTSGSYKNLYYTSQRLKHDLASYKGLNNINSSINFNYQQYQITVNRRVAATIGVSIGDIDSTIAELLGGKTVSHFTKGAYRYDVILQAQNKFLHSAQSLKQFYVPNSQGQLVSLASLIKVKQIVGQKSLPHYNHLRSADISAQLSKGYTIGQAVHFLEKTLPKVLPSDTHYAFTGMAEFLQKNNDSMLIIFGLALVFIYLILAALFESFLDPLIVLLTIPLCIVGALAGLKLVGGTLNVYSDIGLITLVGLVSKHGILITQFINEQRRNGAEMHEAIVKGAVIRLRPILMTTTAMVFGVLPLLFTGGASANSRLQIGIVLIAGLIVGTFFSLFVVPITYSLLGRFKKIK